MRTFIATVTLALACFASPAWAERSPLAPGDHVATLNGLKLHYSVKGSGPVAIFPTPGWGVSHEYLSMTLTPLEQQFTLVYLDTRATGRSEAPQSEAITIEDFVADLEALRAHLGMSKTWFIGHSMGTAQAMEYALRHPQRVEGLVLLNALASWQDPDVQRERAYRSAGNALLEQKRGRPGFDVAYAAWTTTTLPETDDAFKQLNLAMGTIVWSDSSKAERAADAFEQVKFSLGAYRRTVGWSVALEPELHRIQAPTLIVASGEDVLTPLQQALILHRGIAGSKLLVIEDGGHFPWIEQPEAFFEGVRAFLPLLGYRGNERPATAP